MHNYRVDAEWIVEDMAEAEQLAAALMLLGAQTAGVTPDQATGGEDGGAPT